MHIAIIAPEQIPVPPILGGSVEITILAVARELAKQHTVTVVSRSHPRYPRYSTESGLHIHRVPSGSQMQYLKQVKRFLTGRRYDVIQIDNRPRFVAPLKKLFPHTTISLFLHSLTFVSPPYATSAQAAQGIRSADLVLGNSASLVRRLSSRFPAAAATIRKVWLGVDTNRFKPASGSGRSRPFTALYAGRMIPRKGVSVLLRAVQMARRRTRMPIRLLIAGGTASSGYGRRMRSLSAKLGLKASFLGTVPHRRIHRVYQMADVLVCPSQKHEAFGLVNVEAMASGLPVIASQIGGIREVVKHNHTGYLIRHYRSPEAFARSLGRLAEHPSLRARMAQRARKDSLSRFSWSATARRLTELYERSVRPVGS